MGLGLAEQSKREKLAGYGFGHVSVKIFYEADQSKRQSGFSAGDFQG